METRTKAEFSRDMQLSKARISQLVKQGLPCTDDGRVKVREAIAWIKHNVLPQNGAVTGPAGSGDLGDAKLRLMLAQAEKAELDVAAQRGELVPLAMVKKAIGSLCRAQRDTTLAFAARRGPELAAGWGVDPRVVVAELDAALRMMLTDLADEPIPYPDDAP